MLNLRLSGRDSGYDTLASGVMVYASLKMHR